MPNQLYATNRDIDDLGVAPAALAAIPVRRRRLNLRFASGHFETYLRKRHALPLKPWIEEVDTTGLTGGADVAQSGSPTLVQDVVIRFPGGGMVGMAGLTYEVSLDAGETFAAAVTLPLSGKVILDGVTTTFSGPITAADSVAYSTAVDAALRGHVVAFVAWKLLHNRGLDPSVEQDLQSQYEAAIKWGEDIRSGNALLAAEDDSTPNTSEDGPLGTGQTDAQDFLDECS